MKKFVLAIITLFFMAIAGFSGNVLGVTQDGKYFTVNGGTVFLKSISYFGALSINDPDLWEYDLRRFKSEGINCVRIFANWWEGAGTSGIFNEDCCSAVWLYDPDGGGSITIGSEREEAGVNYLDRLIAFCELCDDAGIAVDISFYWYGVYTNPLYLTFTQVEDCVQTVVAGVRDAGLKNIFFDVANEFEVSTFSSTQVGYLASSVKDIYIEGGQDPDYFYLCTASCGCLDVSSLDAGWHTYLGELLQKEIDFLAPHFYPRGAGAWNNTAANIARLILEMGPDHFNRRVPIHCQEPFCYGDDKEGDIANYNYEVIAYVIDLKAAKNSGGAGWCFHTEAGFWMADMEFFEQLNAVELSFLEKYYRISAEGSTLRTVADYDGDGTDEVAVDFGTQGIKLWNAGSWSQLSAYNPDFLVAADTDGDGTVELVASFGSAEPYPGVYLWDGGSWSTLTYSPAEAAISANIDQDSSGELVVDFGSSTGLYSWNGGTWAQLSGNNPGPMVSGDVDNDGVDEIIADFGDGSGLWLLNGSTWSQMTEDYADSLIAADIDADGYAEIIGNFGVWTGFYVYNYGATPAWTSLSPDYADSAISAELDGTSGDELVVDFGPAHFWVYNSAWYNYSDLDAEAIIEADVNEDGVDEIVGDFGILGLWLRTGANWSSPIGYDPEHIWAGDLDGDGDDEFLADFGALGLNKWDSENGGTWTQISTSDPD